MRWKSYDAALPPHISQGGVISFRGVANLAGLLETELMKGRLLAIDLSQVELQQKQTFRLQISGRPGEVKIPGRAVYREADLVGLQLDCDEAARAALMRLVRGSGERPTVPDFATADLVKQIDARTGAKPPVKKAARRRPKPAPAPTTLPEPGISARPSIAEAVTLPPLQSRAEPSGNAALLFQSSSTLEPIDLGHLPTPTPAPQPMSAPSRPRRRLPIRNGELKTVRRMAHFLGDQLPPTVFGLLHRLQRRRRPGRLTLAGAKGSCQLDIHPDGGIVDFEADLVTALTASGDLDSYIADRVSTRGTAVKQAQSLLDINGGLDGPSLSTVRRTMRGQLLAQLVAISHDNRLKFEFDPNYAIQMKPDLSFHFLDYACQWLGHFLGQVSLTDLRAHFEDRLFWYPVLVSDRSWNARRLSLDRQQTRFIKDILAIGRCLRDLLTFSPLGPARSLRLLVMLEALEMIEFSETAPTRAEVEDVETALKRRLASGQRDHFGALSVHFTAHPSEYDAALARIQKKYDPDGDLARASQIARGTARQIVDLAIEAHRYLRVLDNRKAYRNQLYDAHQLTSAGNVLVEKMRLAAFRGNVDLVRELHEVATELGVVG